MSSGREIGHIELERLEPAAVTERLLRAAFELPAGGRLAIALPDRQRLLDEVRRGARDPIEAASSFCSFETDGAETSLTDPETVRTILADRTPFRTAVDLRRAAIDRFPRLRFVRQNAYALGELCDTLRTCGLSVVEHRTEGDVVHVVAEPAAVLGDALEHLRAGRWERAIESLRDAVERAPAIAGAHRRLLYRAFAEAARGLAGTHERDDDFERVAHRIGAIDRRGVERLTAGLANARRVKLAIEDYAPGFVHNPDLNERDLGEINRSHDFLLLGPNEQALVAPLLEELRAPIGRCLGARFRIVNVRCWTSHPEGVASQTNDWHNDEGFPAEVFKVMVYLTGASPELGSTEVFLPSGEKLVVDGPPGTFLVFKNYARTHRAVIPRRGERIVMEVTVLPSRKDEVAHAFAGFNAEFPAVPW